MLHKVIAVILLPGEQPIMRYALVRQDKETFEPQAAKQMIFSSLVLSYEGRTFGVSKNAHASRSNRRAAVRLIEREAESVTLQEVAPEVVDIHIDLTGTTIRRQQVLHAE